jgi:hypothetical protein
MRRKHMVTNSWKPKEWVGIANEPNYIFTTAHVLLLKDPTQLPWTWTLKLHEDM